MARFLKGFNELTDGSNLNKSDWYIPACGQLALMFPNMTDINTVLEKIGGTEISAEDFWSSTEHTNSTGWYINMRMGQVWHDSKYDDDYYYVRFIRDIESE